jgi:putative ABC transport system substrate-binding protein
VEGQTLSIEWREEVAGENAALVAELVALPVDVLVTVGTPPTIAARRATDAIPIVFESVSDPVGVGLVATLARPGGNVTGVSTGTSTPLNAKQVEVLRDVVSGLRHVAYMGDAANNPGATAVVWPQIQEAARLLGVRVERFDVSFADELENAFATYASWPASGLIVRPGSVTLTQRTRIADLAAQHHLPAMYAFKEFVDAGGLMSYGSSKASTHRHVASYVDRILRGARPADLPVEQLSTVEFVVNVRAAQALGLSIPRDVAAQVTEWIN